MTHQRQTRQMGHVCISGLLLTFMVTRGDTATLGPHLL